MSETYLGHTEEELTALAQKLAHDHHMLWHDLVQARREQGISQAQIAEFLGISQSAVAQFERYDNDPRMSTVRRYALAVGMALHTEASPAFGERDKTTKATDRRTDDGSKPAHGENEE